MLLWLEDPNVFTLPQAATCSSFPYIFLLFNEIIEYKWFIWTIVSGHFNANVKKHISVNVKCLTGQLFHREIVGLETGGLLNYCNCCV